MLQNGTFIVVRRVLWSIYNTSVVFCVQQMLGMTVPVTADDDTVRHTFGIDIRMMHLSAKDFFNVWDFAGQV